MCVQGIECVAVDNRGCHSRGRAKRNLWPVLTVKVDEEVTGTGTVLTNAVPGHWAKVKKKWIFFYLKKKQKRT